MTYEVAALDGAVPHFHFYRTKCQFPAYESAENYGQDINRHEYNKMKNYGAYFINLKPMNDWK